MVANSINIGLDKIIFGVLLRKVSGCLERLMARTELPVLLCRVTIFTAHISVGEYNWSRVFMDQMGSSEYKA